MVHVYLIELEGNIHYEVALERDTLGFYKFNTEAEALDFATTEMNKYYAGLIGANNDKIC